jgi:hypothetical protein
MPTTTRRLRVHYDDPVAHRLARLIARESPHPRLGSHEDMLRLRSFLMRQDVHYWRVCARCDTPFNAVTNPNVSLCDDCMPKESE